MLFLRISLITKYRLMCRHCQYITVLTPIKCTETVFMFAIFSIYSVGREDVYITSAYCFYGYGALLAGTTLYCRLDCQAACTFTTCVSYIAGVSAVNTKHDCAVSDALVTVSGQSHCYRQGQIWISITWKYCFLIPIQSNKLPLSWELQNNESVQNPATAPNLLLTNSIPMNSPKHTPLRFVLIFILFLQLQRTAESISHHDCFKQTRCRPRMLKSCKSHRRFGPTVIQFHM
jgi:hypothetical protein